MQNRYCHNFLLALLIGFVTSYDNFVRWESPVDVTQGDSVSPGSGGEHAQRLAPVVLELFDGAGWGGRDGFEDVEGEAGQRKDVLLGVVAAVGVAVLAESDVLVSMHDLDASMAAIDGEKRLGRDLAVGDARDQIDDLRLSLFPLAVFLDLSNARYAADMRHARPVLLDPGGDGGQRVDRTFLAAPMALFEGALKRAEGENRLLESRLDILFQIFF